MTSAYEPVLHALSVEPRVARPGETVCVIFRTRNLGTLPSPAGTVDFVLGDGLEALGELDVAVDSVAPGEDVVATVRARVRAPLDDRTELIVQAVLRVPDAVLGTNVCAVRVRSRGVLDGAASGTFVEMLDSDHVRVRVVVANEGDGAARDVRVVAPAPAGCVRADGDGPAMLHVERLDAGASAAVEFEARIVEPVVVVRADDVTVRFGESGRCVLAAREVVVLEPALATPCVDVRPLRRRAEVAIDVRNDGWVDARDVRVRIALPATLRAVDGSFVVDGVPAVAHARRRSGGAAFARVERSGGAYVVVMSVAARSAVRVTFAAALPVGFADGTIVVGVGSDEVAVPIVPELVRDVRLRLIDVPRVVAAGEEVGVVAEVVNAGDVPEALFFCIDGAPPMRAEDVERIVAPGMVADVALAVRAPDSGWDNAPLSLAVVARDADGERARIAFALTVRDAASRGEGDPPADDVEPVPAAVHTVLQGPDDVCAGAPFVVRADIDVEDDVELLAVRIPSPAGATYVPGSTTLDGRSLLDRGGVSPLDGAGLLLRGVPAGTRVSAACTLLAGGTPRDAALIVGAVVDVDGDVRPLSPIAVNVRGRDPFALQPAGLPYHVDASVIAPATSAAAGPAAQFETPARSAAESCGALEPIDLEPIVVESAPPATAPALMRGAAFTFRLGLDVERLDEIARLLHGATGSGLAAHLLALRAFFPDGETSGDGAVAAALDELGCAVRDVFDRLFVKLRIPGFDVASDDLEDPVLRGALTALCQRLLDAAPGVRDVDGASASVERDRVRDLLDAFGGRSYGSPAALVALVALLPTRCEDDPRLGGALAAYARALDDALARYDGVPLELFDDALARASDGVLDDARAAVVAAMRRRAAVAEVAC